MKIEANLGFGRNFDFHIFLFTGKIVLVTLIVCFSKTVTFTTFLTKKCEKHETVLSHILAKIP